MECDDGSVSENSANETENVIIGQNVKFIN